ncbi:hypothetical protein KC347_g246 [Hortaea werneckii]|nr:hypothetical protein KC347_g246 [Hortaea werneckii]
MSAHILMQGDLELKLLWSQTAGAEGMFLVDEFDRDDRRRGVGGSCFAICTYEAYAPDPIVFEMMRKGRLLGRGATWD